jgi:hypothetical protein
MQIVDFFEKCAGKWFSQRASHEVDHQAALMGKSDLWMEVLPAADPKVTALCDRHHIAPDQTAIALGVRWEATIAASPKKEVGATVLVAIAPDADQGGKFLAQVGTQPGHYSFDAEGALVLSVPVAGGHFEERLWFVTDNLRMRTSTLIRDNGETVASFCSEIRMGVQPPAAEA